KRVGPRTWAFSSLKSNTSELPNGHIGGVADVAAEGGGAERDDRAADGEGADLLGNEAEVVGAAGGAAHLPANRDARDLREDGRAAAGDRDIVAVAEVG